VALGIIFLKPSSTKKPPPPPPKSPVVEEMLKVEAGAITLKDGASAQVGTFYMDKHEVTVRQYAEFVRADTLKFDHAKQPASKTSHKPAHWDEFYAAAKEGGLFRGARLTLDSPMSFVDWWDAYAYAAWRGRRLPTLNEWLLAATGDGTRPYPWGTQEDPQNANTSKDYPPKAEPNVAPGSVDGHAHWAEVDAMKKDVTPQGILGLAGNVSEWVSDWGQNPDLPDEQSPMFCGGNFALPLAPLQDQRYPTKKLIYAELNVGLRTVSDTPPKP
jgi:formylglycine-generating enzyme required for sulfatase activity